MRALWITWALVTAGPVSRGLQVPPQGARFAADDAPVAMCMPGHYRSMFSVEVVTTHLAAFEHLTNLKRFAVLAIDGDSAGSHREGSTNTDLGAAFEAEHREGLAMYDFSGVHVMDHEGTFAAEFFRTGASLPLQVAAIHVGPALP